MERESHPPITPQTRPWENAMSPVGPVLENQRVTAIDVLRGVALLGILILNIQSFSMPGAAYLNPTAYGDLNGANYWVWCFSHLLGEQKFMTIFSMLFGAGIVLMTSRMEQSGRSSAGVHYARMGWLILFGLLHAHLLWYGDILYSYGMCGLVAWPFRKMQPSLLIALGSIVVAVPIPIWLLCGWSMQFWDEPALADIQTDWSPSQDVIASEVAAYQGSWLEQMPYRTSAALMFQTFLMLFWTAWRAGGLMLIGMGLFKLGVFSAKRSNVFYVFMSVVGLFVGTTITAIGIHRNFQVNWNMEFSFFFGSQFNYIGSVFTALGLVGVVMFAVKLHFMKWLLRRLEAVGRMALTNYLMHTLICTTIFYGHGFGYFGKIERTGQLMIVMGVWIAQLIYSPIWLHYFRFGPFEWLWRSLTYWKLQPVRRWR